MEMKLTFGDTDSIQFRNASRPDSDTSTGEANKFRVQSRTLIDGIITEGRAAEMTGDEVQRLVNASYPFGERSGHPYRMWMKEVNERMGRFRQERRENQDPL